MRLDEYEWSRNPRGLHNKAAPFRMDFERMIRARYGWCKMVCIGGEYMDDLPWMLSNGITPIIRVFRHNWGAAPATDELIGIWRAYANSGVKWFEFYNEPNLGNEWPNGTVQDYRNTAGIIAPLMENWLSWAEMMVSWGCYPAFPALSEATGDIVDVNGWLQAMLNYLAERQYDRFRAVMNNGLWVATHPYIYNHFYQEGEGPLKPRFSTNAQEGGWHFEYPYDPISQATHPGITTVSGTGDFPRGDPIGLCGVGEAFLIKAYELFGGGAIPVVGTEGGIYPVPQSPGEIHQIDDRYPAVGWQSHGEGTLAMFNWIADQAPPWMFGVALWKENDYYEGPGGHVPAVGLMETNLPRLKSVPPLEALGNVNPGALLAGPGPVQGTPDHHALLLAPDLNPDWFFNGAKSYYEKFRPQILTDVEYISHIPHQTSLAVTVLATPATQNYAKEQISQHWANVLIDLIIVETEADLAKVLAQRVKANSRLGK
ncbi:MAG: hypothetical protein U0528_08410 [Anaerolineae bacterium]